MAGLYVVEDAALCSPIGECGFAPNNYINGVEASIMLLPEFQARGYGRTILKALWAFWVEQLGNDSCVATAWSENIHAASLLTSQHFSQVDQYTDVLDIPHLVFERRR